MIYLDNAATSYPKPAPVIEAVVRCLSEQGANPGRGAYPMALAASRVIFEAREAVAELIGASDAADVVFTVNATDGLNLALKGLLRPGDHAIASGIEHNAVARPLSALADRGVFVDTARHAPDGTIDLVQLESLIRSNTRLIVTVHASNVLGTILPVSKIAALAKRHGVLYVLDAAQTAGCQPLDVGALGADVVVFSGHKGVLGPMGTGAAWISPRVEVHELRQGGTGGESERTEQPCTRPDRYESGTLNTPGIAGLGAAARFVLDEGVATIAEREAALAQRLLAGLASQPGVTVYGPPAGSPRVPVISINVAGMDAHELAFLLDREHGIAARSGLHCAPSAHSVMGTLETGVLRFGIGFFNTESEIDQTLAAVHAITEDAARRAG